MNTSWRVSWIPMCMRAYIRVPSDTPATHRGVSEWWQKDSKQEYDIGFIPNHSLAIL